jgi:phosphate uptake regulator
MLGGLQIPNTADLERNQAKTASTGPSAEAVAEADEFLLDEIFRDLSLIWSYATSAMEAARRGDRDELRLRLRVQLRDCFRHAVELHNLLSTGQPKGSGL